MANHSETQLWLDQISDYILRLLNEYIPNLNGLDLQIDSVVSALWKDEDGIMINIFDTFTQNVERKIEDIKITGTKINKDIQMLLIGIQNLLAKEGATINIVDPNLIDNKDLDSQFQVAKQQLLNKQISTQSTSSLSNQSQSQNDTMKTINQFNSSIINMTSSLEKISSSYTSLDKSFANLSTGSCHKCSTISLSEKFNKISSNIETTYLASNIAITEDIKKTIISNSLNYNDQIMTTIKDNNDKLNRILEYMKTELKEDRNREIKLDQQPPLTEIHKKVIMDPTYVPNVPHADSNVIVGNLDVQESI